MGGASSSASLPALGLVVSRSAEELAASEPPELSAAAAYGTTHGLHGVPSRVLSRALGVSPFDDLDEWNFAEESAHFEGSAQARVDSAAGARSPSNPGGATSAGQYADMPPISRFDDPEGSDWEGDEANALTSSQAHWHSPPEPAEAEEEGATWDKVQMFEEIAALSKGAPVQRRSAMCL